ncbi:MAG: LptE family protein [Chitinophagales bacterium]
MASFVVFASGSCKIYRFTDASIDPNLKTFNVTPTINIATLQNPNAAPNFTDKVKDKFLSNTRMVLTQDNGDLQFAATIIEYNIEPVSITNTETTAQNRLNIAVKFECINTKEATKSFTQTFRDGENFDANAQFSSVESGLNNTIFDRLTQQIFNKIFGNW